MSSISAPFGLRPSFFPTGLERPQGLVNGIASGLGSNIFKGQPVKYNSAAGTIAPVTGTEAFVGAFAGVDFTDTTGRRRTSNFWPAGTTGTEIVAYFYNDPNIVYEVQATGSLAQTAVGQQANIANPGAGSTGTGLSGAQISTTTVSGSLAQLRIVDLAPNVDNAWGDAFTNVRVQISNHQFVATINAV